MKIYVFTQSGGFPFTQNVLDLMQQQYVDVFQAFYGLIRPVSFSGDMVVFSGVDLLSGDYATSGVLSPGYFLHKTKGIIPFAGGSFNAGSNNNNYLLIVDSTESLTFADNTAHPVIHKRQVIIGNIDDPAATGWDTSGIPSMRINDSLALRSIAEGQQQLGDFTFFWRKNRMSKETALYADMLVNSTFPVSIGGVTTGGMPIFSLSALPSELRPPKSIRFFAPVTTPGGDPILAQGNAEGYPGQYSLGYLNAFVEITPAGVINVQVNMKYGTSGVIRINHQYHN